MSSTANQDNPLGDLSKVSVEDVLRSIGAYNAGVQATAGAAQDAIAAQKAISDNSAEVLSQVGDDASTVSLAASAAEMDKQARIAKTAAFLGVDVNAQNSQYQALSAQATEAQHDKDEALAVIKKKQSVGFLENPMQYVFNQLTVNGDIAKHNIANAQLQSAHERIIQLNQEAQTTFQTEKELAVGTTQASAEASARMASASAQLKANDARIQGLQYGIAGIDRANNTSKQIYDAMYTGFGARKMEQGMQVQLQQLKLARDAAAEHIREFNLTDSFRREQAEDRADAQNAGQAFVDTINKGRIARGVDLLDDVNGKQVLAYFKTGKGVLSATMQFDYANGEAMNVKGGEQQILATSPAQYAIAKAQNIPIKLTPQQAPVDGLISQVINEVGNPNNLDPTSIKFSQDYAAAKATKDANAMSAVFNARVQHVFDMKAANVNSQDANNPYAITSINALAEQSPTVANTAFYQKILKDRASHGEQLMDANKVFNAGVDAIAKGTLSMPEFLDISTIYQVGVNNARAQRNIQGLVGVIPRVGYNTTVNGQVVDLTHPDAVARAAVLELTRRSRLKLLQSNYSRPTGPD